MTESPRQTPEKRYMPSALVRPYSISQMLIGLAVAILVTLLLAGYNISISPKFDLFAWLSFAWPSVAITIAGGALAVAANHGYRHGKGWGLYAHALAVLFQVYSVTHLYLLGFPLVIAMAILVVSVAILARITALIRLNPVITIVIIGLGLTFSSFAYQQMGPEIGRYGTECIPLEECFGPLLGSGFPFQYLIDRPGITGQGHIYIVDDEFRVLSFILDAVFYFAVVWLIYMAVRHFRGIKERAD